MGLGESGERRKEKKRKEKKRGREREGRGGGLGIRNGTLKLGPGLIVDSLGDGVMVNGPWSMVHNCWWEVWIHELSGSDGGFMGERDERGSVVVGERLDGWMDWMG